MTVLGNDITSSGWNVSLDTEHSVQAKLGADIIIAKDLMPCGHLADDTQTVVSKTVCRDMPVLNVYNVAGEPFKFRKEVAIHPDGRLEITSRQKVAAYAEGCSNRVYQFYVPLSLLKGATFKAYVGKSYGTKSVTGNAGDTVIGMRYVAFSGGRRDLVMDFNPYGVSDWQDYCKWGFPTARWHMETEGEYLKFWYGDSAKFYGDSVPFYGKTLAGKVLIYEGAWDFEQRHPYTTYHYRGITPAMKRFAFGASGKGLVPVGLQLYTPEQGWGWENNEGLTLSHGEGTDVLDHAVVSASGERRVFRADVPPGYYVVTARFRNPSGSSKPFSVQLNDQNPPETVQCAEGEAKAVLLQTYATNGQLRVALEGAAGWLVNSLSVQVLIYQNEDFFMSRGMWLADGPDVDDESLGSLNAAVAAPVAVPSSDRDWPWNCRMAHFGGLVYSDRDSLILPEDIERRILEIKKLGYNTVMLDGWHMWPSFQSRLAAWTESTRRRVEVAHRNGLKVVDHFDVPVTVYTADGFKYLQQHLDWCQRDIRNDEPTFRQYCLNNPGFRQAFLEFLETYARNTGIDGVMLDECTFSGKEFCGCRFCREKFTKDTGRVLPREADSPDFFNYDSRLWTEWLTWRQKTIGDWWQDVRAALDRVRPDIRILLYTSPSGISTRWAPHDLAFDLMEDARNCDFVGTEIMTRNVLDGYRAVLSYRKLKSALGELYDIPIYGLIYPVGNPEFAYFGWALQQMNKQVSIIASFDGDGADRYIDWPWQMRKADAESVADIGILFSRQSRDFARLMPHHDEAMGISESLSDAHIQHDFLLDQDITPEKLGRYRMIILPSVECMSPSQVAAIEAYVAGGGQLFCTGSTSLFDEHGFQVDSGLQLRKVLGADCTNHLSVATASAVSLSEGAAPVPYNGAVVDVCRAENSDAAFRGHLLNAAGEEIEPALVEHTFGKGRVFWLPWNPGSVNCELELRVNRTWTYQRNDELHRLLIATVRDMLTPLNPRFQAVSIPEKVVVSVYRQLAPEERLMVHLLNAGGAAMQPGETLVAKPRDPAFPPLQKDLVFDIFAGEYDTVFAVSPDYKEKRTVALQKLPNGYLRVTLDRNDLQTYTMICFVKKGR